MILRSTSVLEPSSTLTWADVNIGLPTLIMSLLMVPFSLFFHYAYNIKPYLLKNISYHGEDGHYDSVARPQYQGGLFKVKMWSQLFSIPDLIRGISPGDPYQRVRLEPYDRDELQGMKPSYPYAQN
jgi:hypothetical protein